MKLDRVEQAMLEQTYRFGLGIPELGSLVQGIGDLTTGTDVLDALSAKGYLGQAPLFGRRRYYFLANRAQTDFDVNQNETGPLKETEKALRYAMLRVALESSPPHRPLTPTDFRDYFPELFDARPRGTKGRRQQPRFRNYYLAGHRLGLLRVESLSGGRFDRILKKACGQIATHLNMPAYEQLIRNKTFEVTIAIAFPSKAMRLRADLADMTTDVPIAIRVVSELREFIAPPKLINH